MMQQPQQERNYTASAWLSAALTFLFVIPGLIAVLINLAEAHTWKKRTGISPQGYGCLWAVLAWTLAPVIGFLVLIAALTGVFATAAAIVPTLPTSNTLTTPDTLSTCQVSGGSCSAYWNTPAVTISASSIYADLMKAPEGIAATNSRNDTNWTCCTYTPENGAIAWTQGSEGTMDIAVFASNDEATTDEDQLASSGFAVWSQGGCLLSYDESVSLKTVYDYQQVLGTYC